MLTLVPLAAVPISAALRFLLGASPLWVFATASVGVMALAYQVSDATERVADRAGPAVGGLLNVSFGSVAELVLAVSVLADGQAGVVRAQITGSIIGTGLLGLGLAILVGGATRERQAFKRERAGLLCPASWSSCSSRSCCPPCSTPWCAAGRRRPMPR